MGKFIFLDHGGVLEQYSQALPNEATDLAIYSDTLGMYRILRNGVAIVKHLNELVNVHGYKIGFHSANDAEAQQDLLNFLIAAAKNKKLTFPPIFVAGVMDKRYVENKFDNPKIVKDPENGVNQACFMRVSNQENHGKGPLRVALTTMLVSMGEEIDKANSWIFDDGDTVIKAARDEGFVNSYLVSDSSSLEAGIEEALKHARLTNQTTVRPTDSKYSHLALKSEKKSKPSSSREREQKDSKHQPCSQSHRQKLGQPVLLTQEPTPTDAQKLASLLQEAHDQIIPHLFLGNGDCGAKRLDSLADQENSDFVILRCTTAPLSEKAKAKKATLEAKGLLKILPIGDSADNNISMHFDECFTFIDQAIRARKKVLVHCDAGASRSPSIVAAYLIRKYSLTAQEAINHIRNKRSCVDTSNFTPQLEQYANEQNTLVKEFLSRHEASYKLSFFNRTNLKGLDADSILEHAKRPTFFKFKNRTHIILKEMGVIDNNGKLINPEFKAPHTHG